MRFSSKEVRDMLLAWVAISLAFAILLQGAPNLISQSFFSTLILSFFVSGLSFIAHELMHKYVAQNQGVQVEFKTFYWMLAIALAISFTGFLFVIPGVVLMASTIGREKTGKIALAGPIANILLAILFLFAMLIPSPSSPSLIFWYGFKINAILAFFNMLPISPLDGAKVYVWSKRVYYPSTLIALLLFILSFFY